MSAFYVMIPVDRPLIRLSFCQHGDTTVLQVLDEVGADMRARVRTCDYTSKLHLVDLAGEVDRLCCMCHLNLQS